MPTASIPYVLTLGFLFGSTLLASRFSVGQFHPAAYVGLRLVIAALAHAAVYAFSARRWPRRGRLWLHGMVLGVLGTAAPMTLIVSSLQFQSSGLTSILLTLGPAITVVLAHVFLPDEKLNRRKVLGVVLAFSGAILMAVLGESGLAARPGSPIGYVLVFSAMFLGSSASVYIRRYVKDVDPFDLGSLRMVFAALGSVVFVSLFVGFDLSGVNAQGYAALGYASLSGTFLGMLLSLYIIQRFGATPAAMTAYIIPVVASIGGLLVLGERITVGMLGGMALIAAGIAVINRKPRHSPLPVQP